MNNNMNVVEIVREYNEIDDSLHKREYYINIKQNTELLKALISIASLLYDSVGELHYTNNIIIDVLERATETLEGDLESLKVVANTLDKVLAQIER